MNASLAIMEPMEKNVGIWLKKNQNIDISSDVSFWANYGGDISVFLGTLQGGHKCLPVNTTGGDTSVFLGTLQRGTQVSSREHYRGGGDTSIFLGKLQGGHKFLSVNTTGGDTSVFPVKLQGGHLDFFFVFL